jgi:Tol biopolymer transport system component
VLGTPGSDGKESILLADRAGEAIRSLAEVDAPVFFAWSPDGKKLAYLATDPGLMGGLAQILTVIEPENPEVVVKAKEELVVAFFWSPDSRQIAFLTPAVFSPTPSAGQEGAPQQVFYLRLYVLDVQTGESRELALFRPTQDLVNILPYFDQYSRSATIWSPDSRNLVIPANSQEGEPNIFVVEADGDPRPTLITDGTMAFWSSGR